MATGASAKAAANTKAAGCSDVTPVLDVCYDNVANAEYKSKLDAGRAPGIGALAYFIFPLTCAAISKNPKQITKRILSIDLRNLSKKVSASKNFGTDKSKET